MSRVQNEISKLNSLNPHNHIDRYELDDIFNKFSTLIWLLNDRKTTKNTVFIEFVENDVLKDAISEICGFTSDLELYKELIMRSPAISNSKLIKNRLKFARKLNNIHK